jgi:hypothetical protein
MQSPGHRASEETDMRVRCRRFKGVIRSWEDLCGEAGEFASTIPRDRLINIAVTADGGRGVVFVWYWE